MADKDEKLSRRGFLGGTAAAAIGGQALAASSQDQSAEEQAPRLVSSVTIPPQSGRGVFLERDQWIKVITPEGTQVSDLFAFVRHAPDEYLCPRTTMTRQRRLYPQVGEPFYSNKRRPLLMLEEDTVGVHDLFYPACDKYMYRDYWGDENHPSCRGNLERRVERARFRAAAATPSPITCSRTLQRSTWKGICKSASHRQSREIMSCSRRSMTCW